MIPVKEINSRNRNDPDRGASVLATSSPFAGATGRVVNVADVGWGTSLEINIAETPRETRWILQGRLFGPWVRTLASMWKTSTRIHTGRKRIVVLNEVSFVDNDAEELFRAMSDQGARFIAKGLYIEPVLERLNICVGKSSSRSIMAFFAALLPGV